MERGLLETKWRNHYTYESGAGSRVVFQAPANKTKSKGAGITVSEEEENFEDYIGDEVDLWLHLADSLKADDRRSVCCRLLLCISACVP